MSWNCPYCQHSQVVTEKNSDTSRRNLDVGKASSDIYQITHAIRCLNKDCGKVTIHTTLYQTKYDKTFTPPALARN